MATVYNAKTIIKKGDLSKQHVCKPDAVPPELVMNHEEVVDIVLIERESQLLSTVNFKWKRGPDDDGLQDSIPS